MGKFSDRIRNNKAKSRYSHPCPVCGAIIGALDKPHGAEFSCPTCGEWLKYDYKHVWLIWIVSIAGASILTRYLGYSGLVFIPIAMGATLFLRALGVFLVGILDPPGFKRTQGGKPYDRGVSLHLTGKPDSDKKTILK
jgi:hypothetical protein